jgi:hypothetical protein
VVQAVPSRIWPFVPRADASRTPAQKRRWHEEFTEAYRRLKTETPCTDCGGLFHHAAMEWDHLPGSEKVAELSTLFRKGRKRAFLNELAKCELVCSNCHAVRSFERMRGA